MAINEAENQEIIISLLSEEIYAITLDELSSFLYDFNNLYSLVRLAIDEKYSEFKFTNYVFYRSGKPLQATDRMYVERIRLESPLDMAVYITASGAAIGAVWAVIQIIEKLYNFRLNRQKLELEVEKLRREKESASKEGSRIISPDEALHLINERGANSYIENIKSRLEHSTIQIVKIDFDIVERNSRRKDDIHR